VVIFQSVAYHYHSASKGSASQDTCFNRFRHRRGTEGKVVWKAIVKFVKVTRSQPMLLEYNYIRRDIALPTISGPRRRAAFVGAIDSAPAAVLGV